MQTRSYARVGGVLYLVVIAIGALIELGIRQRIGVPDAANAGLWRLGILGELVLLVCAVGVTWVFYVVLRDVNRELALLGVMLNMVGVIVEAASTVQLVLAGFQPGPAGGMAVMTFGTGFGIALFFNGIVCGLFGWLIHRLSRVVGTLYMLAGLAYAAHSVALVLAPAVAMRMFMYIAVPAFIGETTTAVWLLFTSAGRGAGSCGSLAASPSVP